MENGQAIKLFGTFQNIDEQKRNQLLYHEINERYSFATKTAKIGIWDYDFTKNELIWDDNMFHLYGIDKNDFSGAYEAWESSLHPADKIAAAEAVNKSIQNNTDFKGNFRIIKPNGDIRYIKAHGAIKKFADGTTKMVGVNHDINELQKTQSELTKIEQAFIGSFENASVGMAILNLDGFFVQANKSTVEIFGFSTTELNSLSIYDLTHKDEKESTTLTIKKLISGKANTVQLERKYLTKKGALIHTVFTLTSVYDKQGKLVHFVAQWFNITDRIKTQEKEKQLHEVNTKSKRQLNQFCT